MKIRLESGKMYVSSLFFDSSRDWQAIPGPTSNSASAVRIVEQENCSGHRIGDGQGPTRKLLFTQMTGRFYCLGIRMCRYQKHQRFFDQFQILLFDVQAARRFNELHKEFRLLCTNDLRVASIVAERELT